VPSDVAGAVCREDSHTLAAVSYWDEVVPLHRIVRLLGTCANPAGRAGPDPPEVSSPPVSYAPSAFSCCFVDGLPTLLFGRSVFGAA
jgi:hypothetical protein